MKKPTLKLVDDAVVEDTLEGYEPLLLSSVEMLDIYWPQTAAVLQSCVDTMYGEMSMQDIYDGVRSGRMYCIIAKNDSGEMPDVALAMVLELAAYPRFTALHIVGLI